MRFTPASIMLAAALALSASSSIGKKAVDRVDAPAAKPWLAYGDSALAAGDLLKARNAYESALLLAPGDPAIYFALGKIARAENLPGKAIKYFDDVVRLDPRNQRALQAQGLAMMDKGAIESARETLASLKALCKADCALAEPLVAAIAAGPPRLATVEASAKIPSQASPSENP